MWNKFEIQVEFEGFKSVDPESVDSIRIPIGYFLKNKNDLEKSGWKSNQIVIEVDGIEEVKEIMTKRIFFKRYNDQIENFVRLNSDLEVGCIAYSIADCKNLELAGVDYIQYDIPSNIEENRINNIPDLDVLVSTETTYGWNLLSLNAPVLVGNLQGLEDFKRLFAQTEISGILMSSWKGDLKNDLKLIRNLTK